MKRRQRNLRCLSLFSGCGGLDLGVRNAGFRVVLATDNDKRCAESHRLNFPESKFLLAPIEELSGGTIRDVLDEPLDLMVGGPPCPPYSKSRFYLQDKPRGLNDPIGDATLAGYLRILAAARPRAFVFENVSGFRYKVHASALELLEAKAEELGYSTTWSVLNAADFGVPQIRERFIMIGMLDRTPVMPAPTHSKSPTPGVGLLPWVTAGSALAELDTEDNANDQGHFAGGQFHQQLCEIPPGDNYLYFTEKRGHADPIWEWRSRYWSFLLKLSPEMPSWTIQARRSNNMGPFHWRNRILRIEEVKRLQTFPDEWALVGTVEQQWRQVGNAVPPLLAQAIGASIASQLRS